MTCFGFNLRVGAAWYSGGIYLGERKTVTPCLFDKNHAAFHASFSV